MTANVIGWTPCAYSMMLTIMIAVHGVFPSIYVQSIVEHQSRYKHSIYCYMIDSEVLDRFRAVSRANVLGAGLTGAALSNRVRSGRPFYVRLASRHRFCEVITHGLKAGGDSNIVIIRTGTIDARRMEAP